MGILDTFYILFDTDAKKAEREMAEVRREGERTADAIDDSVRGARKLAPALDKAADNAGRLGRSFRGIAGLAAGIFAGIGAANLAGGLLAASEGYTRFGNSLRIAGLEGEALLRVENALFASSKRNGVELEGLGTLYSRVASAASELGVSEAEVLQMTDAVSAAIRVQGGNASQASGAMLQLSQALGAGTVRAEEFNSIMEGMLPLLQAAAFASDKYKGSVARLRADVLAGNVTSREFFDLITAGTEYLNDKAAKAPLTVAQSMTSLRNSVGVAIGRLDQAWGVTRRLAAGLAWMGENLEVVGVAFGVAGTIITASFLPAIWSAAAGVLAATWPILAIIAAAAALGVAFALAYDDVKAFLSGQDSLIGNLMERYGWFRATINGLAVVFRVLGRIVGAVFGFIWREGGRLVAALVSYFRGWYAVAAPIFGLLRDIAVAVFRAIGNVFMSVVGPWLPFLRVVFDLMVLGFRAVGQVFGAVFRAIGDWWDRVFGRIVRGLNIVVNGARRLLGMEVSENAQAAASGVGIGQRQLSAASTSPWAAQTSSSVSTSNSSRNTQVNMGGVNITTGANPADIPNALKNTYSDAVFQFDDGVAR
jgi:tape measure domain-containing protein